MRLKHELRVLRGFPDGPVVKNLPSNAGDMGSIPGWAAKIPRAEGQTSLHVTTGETSTHHNEWFVCLNSEPVQPNKYFFKKEH